MDGRCLDAETLELVLGEEPLPEPVESHLAECEICQAQAASLLQSLEESPGGSIPFPADRQSMSRAALRLKAALGIVPRRRVRLYAAAAGLFVLCGVAAGIWVNRPSHPLPFVESPIPSGRSVSGEAEAFSTGAGQTDRIQLPDGTRLRLGERTRARFRPAGPGERYRLELEAGELEADVAPGQGIVRIVHASGRVDVLGTHLRIWTTALGRSDALAGLPRCEALGVEVYEGRVALAGPLGEVLLKRNERGILIPGGAPSVQELGGAPESLLAGLSRLVEKDGERFRVGPGQEAGAALLMTALDGMSRSAAGRAQPFFCQPPAVELFSLAEAVDRALEE